MSDDRACQHEEDAMSSEASEATEEARRAGAPGPADRLLERLAELVGAKAGVQVVFGDPIRHESLTVIPVARVRWGFGGGSGSADGPDSAAASGSGGGGGAAADPIGYLELRGDDAAFQPIREPYPSPAFLIACGLTAALVIRALARLVKG
jgi:uncharacterized spore protein YtfJ